MTLNKGAKQGKLNFEGILGTEKNLYKMVLKQNNFPIKDTGNLRKACEHVPTLGQSHSTSWNGWALDPSV